MLEAAPVVRRPARMRVGVLLKPMSLEGPMKRSPIAEMKVEGHMRHRLLQDSGRRGRKREVKEKAQLKAKK